MIVNVSEHQRSFDQSLTTRCSVLAGLFLTVALVCSPASGAAPLCAMPESDIDNDGWGWENATSCIVAGGVADPAVNPGQIHPTCSSMLSDDDGDGWGWENNQSCRVRINYVPPAFCATLNSDSDGDGWGWENGDSCIVRMPNHITDLILITGQSNTLGAATSVDPALDTPSTNVFAFTSNGWQIAQLHQAWDRKSYPGPGDPAAHSSLIYNNFALHFGKQMAQLDPNRVIGFVLVSEPGEGIENWNPGSFGMTRVQQKVADAINQLPHKSSLDGILWHQGETDWLLEGTSDVDVAQPAPVDYYPTKLTQLISNFRTENWFSNLEPFICGETIHATGVNTHLAALNADGDPFTGCVGGAGLPSTTVGGSHFTAAGLRTLGGWYADLYYAMTK